MPSRMKINLTLHVTWEHSFRPASLEKETSFSIMGEKTEESKVTRTSFQYKFESTRLLLDFYFLKVKSLLVIIFLIISRHR
jgi:hypothetical protein